MIRYARAPSAAFAALLAPSGLLSPLLVPRDVAGVAVDVHLREADHVQVYCGLTRLIDAWCSGGRVQVAAHETYKVQACGAELFRPWSPDEPGFAAAIDAYLADVAVNHRHVQREGAVQVAWAAVRAPWVPFDREAVLGYDDTAAQRTGRVFAAIAAARAEVEPIRLAGRWEAMPKDKLGAELDQLAVDPAGRLVLIELKDAAAKPASVYYSPLQLLQYVHEWAAAFDAVRGQVATLIEARIGLGMSPSDMPRLVEGLRPAVGFGQDHRSAEVRARFEIVRTIVNRHLPAGASPIEVWAFDRSTPVRLE